MPKLLRERWQGAAETGSSRLLPIDQGCSLIRSEPSMQDVLYFVVSYGGDFGDPRVDQVRIAVQRRVLAESVGARVDTCQLVQPVPLELRLGSPQLLLGRPIGEQLINDLHHFLLEVLGAHAIASPGIAEAERVATDEAHR